MPAGKKTEKAPESLLASPKHNHSEVPEDTPPLLGDSPSVPNHILNKLSGGESGASPDIPITYSRDKSTLDPYYERGDKRYELLGEATMLADKNPSGIKFKVMKDTELIDSLKSKCALMTARGCITTSEGDKIVNISSMNSAVVVCDENNPKPRLKQIYTNEKSNGIITASEASNDSIPGIDISNLPEVKGVSSGGFSSCALQLAFAKKNGMKYLIFSHVQTKSVLDQIIRNEELELGDIEKVINLTGPGIKNIEMGSNETISSESDIKNKMTTWVRGNWIYPGDATMGTIPMIGAIATFSSEQLLNKLYLELGVPQPGGLVKQFAADKTLALEPMLQRFCGKKSIQEMTDEELNMAIKLGIFGDLSFFNPALKKCGASGIFKSDKSEFLLKELREALRDNLNVMQWNKTLLKYVGQAEFKELVYESESDVYQRLGLTD